MENPFEVKLEYVRVGRREYNKAIIYAGENQNSLEIKAQIGTFKFNVFSCENDAFKINEYHDTLDKLRSGKYRLKFRQDGIKLDMVEIK
jgi:hypothetical protein